MTRRVLLVLLAMFIIVVPATAITLDNGGGGTWAASVQFLTTDVVSEDAQYKIVINGPTWEIYNALGELEITKSVSDFWSLVDVNGTDIRVYNQSDQLYFWIEEWDYSNQKAVIWVRLEAGSAELNIAYGNPSATKSTYNDISQTFEFGDDFSQDPSTQWTLSTGWSWDSANGFLHFENNEDIGYNAESPYNISDGIVFYKLRYTGTGSGGNDFLLLRLRGTSNDAYIVGLGKEVTFGEGFHIGAKDDGSWRGWLKQVAYDYNLNEWYKVKVIISGVPANIKIYLEDSLMVDWTDSVNQDSLGALAIHGRDCTGDIDYIFVAKLADPADFTVPTTGSYTGFDNANGGAWSQYISIPITTTPSEYAQYKVEINGDTITVYNVTGSVEVNGTVSGFWDNVQPDGDDIRVFNQNFEQLYFWIEEWDYSNQKAVIWVNLTAGSSELNIAYGNPSALRSSYESGEQVFEFFDDFEQFSGWNGKWLEDDSGSGQYSITTSDSKLIFKVIHKGSDLGECYAIYTDKTFGTGYGFDAKFYVSPYKQGTGLRNSYYVGFFDPQPVNDPPSNDKRTVVFYISAWSNWGQKFEANDGSSSSTVGIPTSYTLNTYHVFTVLRYDSEVKGYVDGNYIGSITSSLPVDALPFAIVVRTWSDTNDATIYVDWAKVYKLADPADFGTPVVKLFQKKFGTKTVYVNVTYLDTSTTVRYNPTAYYNLEDVPQINVTSSLPISGVNTTFGAEISIELINFVTLDKVTYNGTEVSVNYQGTITNSTTGLTYNVYKFTTYENGTLEIYGHVGNKAYEATYKLDGDIVDISNVSAIIGEVLDVSLPHRARVLVGRYLFDNVTTLSLNTLNLKIGNNLLQITIDDPENFTVGYTRKEFKVIWGFVDLNITGYENKSFTGYTVAVLNKRYSLLTTSPGRLYAGENEISIFFHGIKLKSVNVVVSHSNNGYEVNVSVNATKIHDYRGVDKIIASPNSFEIVNLSPKYPFAVMGLVNASGEVVIDYGSNAPTSVEVTGDVASYSYEKPVLKLVAAGNVTIADLYKVTEPLKDRLGNPVNFHVSFDGVTAPASNGIAAKLLKPDVYSVTVPTDVLGFRYYRLISSANLVPVPSGREAEGVYVKYTTSTPPSGWNTELLFNDSGWSIGRTPICDKTTCPTYVDLNGGHLYVRYAFNLSKIIRNHYAALNLSEWNVTIEKATVYCEVDDESWVWLNGEQVLYAKISANKWDGQADVTKYLDLEENLLAIHVYDSGAGSNYLDFKLEATIKLTRLNNSFTINVSKDLNLPLAEYRVPTRFETNEVKIERFKLPIPLPIPFLPFSEPQEDEKVYVLVRLEGTLKDYYGAPVPNREVKITISSPNVTRVFNTTTDGSGNFFIETDFAKGIEYTVRYEFVGDDVYVESSTTKTFYPGELPVAPTPPAPAELTLIAIVVAVVAAMIVAAVFVVRRTRATARTRIESEFRFFRRIR